MNNYNFKKSKHSNYKSPIISIGIIPFTIIDNKLEREKAVLSFRQSVLVAVSEVSDALVKVEKLQQQETSKICSIIL